MQNLKRVRYPYRGLSLVETDGPTDLRSPRAKTQAYFIDFLHQLNNVAIMALTSKYINSNSYSVFNDIKICVLHMNYKLMLPVTNLPLIFNFNHTKNTDYFFYTALVSLCRLRTQDHTNIFVTEILIQCNQVVTSFYRFFYFC